MAEALSILARRLKSTRLHSHCHFPTLYKPRLHHPDPCPSMLHADRLKWRFASTIVVEWKSLHFPLALARRVGHIHWESVLGAIRQVSNPHSPWYVPTVVEERAMTSSNLAWPDKYLVLVRTDNASSCHWHRSATVLRHRQMVALAKDPALDTRQSVRA